MMMPPSGLGPPVRAGGRARTPHSAALAILERHASCRLSTEKIPLAHACGRILAAPLVACENIPRHTNSAVDGFAFRHADIAAGMRHFTIGARIAAGPQDAPGPALAPGMAAQIFTGALLPPGADCVAMQEDCIIESPPPGGDHQHAKVTPPERLSRRANCRHAGEDMRAGQTVLQAGQRLMPADIAAAAALGHTQLDVFARLRLALVSSGDEVIAAGSMRQAGQIFDANLPMLGALADVPFAELSSVGILADNAGDTRARLASLAASHDVLITSGGVSFGDADHIVNALDALGKCHLWQIAVKPGRPFAFGRIKGCALLCLPGNPVAALVCFALYARPFLLACAGGQFDPPERYVMPAKFSVPQKKPGRREFYRGWSEPDENGVPHAVKFARDGSGLISGLQKARGLIEILEPVTRIDPGMPVFFLPLSGMRL